jgi:hypothetical protein
MNGPLPYGWIFLPTERFHGVSSLEWDIAKFLQSLGDLWKGRLSPEIFNPMKLASPSAQ